MSPRPALLALLLLALPCAARAGEIKVGLFADLSGPTQGVGRPYAQGVKDAARYLNESGGIRGDTLVPIEADVGADRYGPSQAYTRLTYREHVVALLSWGAGVVEALAGRVAEDRIPTLSASSARLWSPSEAPYTFFTSPDFSIRAMAALRHFRDSWSQSRPPRLAMISPNLPYAMEPLEAVRQYALDCGFELAVEENVDLRATEATAQINRLKEQAPDFLWVGGTAATEAVILRDAARLGLSATILTDVWGSHEKAPIQDKPNAEGTYALEAVALYGQDVPGMRAIDRLTGHTPQPGHYVRGFASMLILAKALEKAKDSGQVTSESVKAALETIRGYDPMGLAPPVTFTPAEHRGELAVMLYRYQAGKPVLAAIASLSR